MVGRANTTAGLKVVGIRPRSSPSTIPANAPSLPVAVDGTDGEVGDAERGVVRDPGAARVSVDPGAGNTRVGVPHRGLVVRSGIITPAAVRKGAVNRS